MRYTAPPSIDCVSDTPGPYDVYAPLSRITRAWRAVIVPSFLTPVLMSMISGWRVRLEGNSSSREWKIFTGRCRFIDAMWFGARVTAGAARALQADMRGLGTSETAVRCAGAAF